MLVLFSERAHWRKDMAISVRSVHRCAEDASKSTVTTFLDLYLLLITSVLSAYVCILLPSDNLFKVARFLVCLTAGEM